MSSLINNIIWYIIHIIWDLYDLSILCFLFITEKIQHLLNENKSSIDSSNINYVCKQIYYIKKIPNHLVIILNDEKIDLNKFANYVLWSQAAGIKYISFYDFKDTHLTAYDELCKFIEKYLINLSNDHDNKITINYLTPKNGKDEIVSLCQQFSFAATTNLLKSNEITIETIDKKLKESLNNLPDPDVALYFGNVCSTYGLLPWQIRLTEFYSIGDQTKLNVTNFLNILRKYSKCEQRFGK